jgi:hypothetical protein
VRRRIGAATSLPGRSASGQQDRDGQGGGQLLDVTPESVRCYARNKEPIRGGLGVMAESWLLLTVSTAGAPDSLRVQVWRRLRSLGALYLHQSVCLLPDRPETARAVHRLLDRVHHDGGSGRLLHLTLSSPGEEGAIIAEFQQDRAAEYQELLDRLPELSRELAAERAKGRLTYAEVEESEADLARFQRWLAKIDGRDYFGCPLRDQARAAVDRCAQDLAAFEAEAFSAESGTPAATAPGRPGTPLRLAKDT